MRISSTLRSMSLLAILLLAPSLALAHTALKQSTPADGATIKTAPTHLELVFTAPVRLIKLELMGVGHQMPTSFEASSESMASYSFETPGMHPGEFTVNWAAIAEDGHTMTNSFSFKVDPAASESSAP